MKFGIWRNGFRRNGIRRNGTEPHMDSIFRGATYTRERSIYEYMVGSPLSPFCYL